jgi:hypothetical protein
MARNPTGDLMPVAVIEEDAATSTVTVARIMAAQRSNMSSVQKIVTAGFAAAHAIAMPFHSTRNSVI